MERGDREKALAHTREARQLATCDGPHDYTYKVAYDEAGALLAKLGVGTGKQDNEHLHLRRRCKCPRD